MMQAARGLYETLQWAKISLEGGGSARGDCGKCGIHGDKLTRAESFVFSSPQTQGNCHDIRSLESICSQWLTYHAVHRFSRL